MSSSSDKMAEEIREVEEELATSGNKDNVPLSDLEEARSRPVTPPPSSSSSGIGAALEVASDKARRVLSLVASPVFAQAFVLTFLGEWGDRSQIATIALAAAHVSLSPTVSELAVLLDRKLILL